jgi:hypothetical protein
MSRTQRGYVDFDDDFDIIDGKKILRDRRSVRVPMFAMDATQRDVRRNAANAVAKITDGSNDPLALHRPG